jgi:hypothetical protein
LVFMARYSLLPGANVTKVFTSIIYQFSQWAQSLCPWQGVQAKSNNHSSLLRKFPNYRLKVFTTLGPGNSTGCGLFRNFFTEKIAKQKIIFQEPLEFKKK